MPGFVNISLFSGFFTPFSVDNMANYRVKTGYYPNNNLASSLSLCITCHLDPSLYGSGSPIVNS
ncbi:hypothetical protein EPYR_03986 [Erwinia pyrifoliae DSM 12163]|nr:hypothetical protein CPI84_19125 [Erwinia pyrifoliae]MCA8875268.1 hypothetical protein [Erwinia pyrifoliae]CAX57482.1 uncharacterized protein EpC_37020 [Erwinia pyrifoliae Ep1/96]CAY76366.1 hypothetical protein EPYR_03986 [Erwinia pyrifoliae DSM 12163]